MESPALKVKLEKPHLFPPRPRLAPLLLDHSGDQGRRHLPQRPGDSPTAPGGSRTGSKGVFPPVGGLASCHFETQDRQKGREWERLQGEETPGLGHPGSFGGHREPPQSKLPSSCRKVGEMAFLFCRRGFRYGADP